jgi:hypothetical protein
MNMMGVSVIQELLFCLQFLNSTKSLMPFSNIFLCVQMNFVIVTHGLS